MTRAPITAVLFDFHQTLFQVEQGESWIHAACERIRRPITEPEAANLLRRINAAREYPEVIEGQRGRDLAPDAHRRATVGWLRTGGVDEELADALYERLLDPCGWHPYRDAAVTLASLTKWSIPVGVISNTGWDLRKTFAHYGMAADVTSFVLSCEHGREKPDADFFRFACAELNSPPESTLMVGDNPESDGGAVRANMHVYLFPPAPPCASRGLSAVLRLVRAEGS